jgi:hypothetical protein
VTQYPNQGYYDPMMQPPMEPAKRSGLAITALVLSLIGIPCCGITAPFGVLLGLIGLVAISPPKKGKGMCLSAIIIGMIMTALWAWLIVFVVRVSMPIIEGPRAPLEQGFAGNIAAFKAEFTGAGATAADDEAEAFIDQLRSRYGEFQSIQMDPGSKRQPQWGQPEVPGDYVIDFSNAQNVPVVATYVMADNQGFVQKWRSITVVDQSLGDLTYPPGATSTTVPATAPAGRPAGNGRGSGGNDDSDDAGG